MNKKYLLVLVIAVAVAAGLYRHIQKKKAADAAAHYAKQYERMLTMAQKSPMAGLSQMGAAINKYKAEHQDYPPTLMDLYPQYIPSKEFITEIQWDYRPAESDFHLSKSMVMGGKMRLASVNSTLMPQMQSSVMVATKKSKPESGAAQPVQTQTQSYEDFVASMAANQALAKRQEAAYRARYREKKAPVIPLLSQSVSFEAADAVDIARATVLEGRYYCWKNDDGSYGYSNIQYPERRKVEKFDDGRWMVVETEFNHRPEKSEDKIPMDSEAQALAALDQHKARSLIVWRDPQGLIGYGNVQYPQKEALEQYEAGGWRALSNVRDIKEDAAAKVQPEAQPEELTDPAVAQSIDLIAAQNSGDYMVWQDEAGHVGFSNVQYPQQKPIQQYQAGDWVAVAPAPQEADDPVGFTDTKENSQKDNTQDVVAAASEKFIVWRDADGHIGISNVQPPVAASALQIHMGGEWLAVAQ
jgi:hypothetical protein